MLRRKKTKDSLPKQKDEPKKKKAGVKTKTEVKSKTKPLTKQNSESVISNTKESKSQISIPTNKIKCGCKCELSYRANKLGCKLVSKASNLKVIINDKAKDSITIKIEIRKPKQKPPTPNKPEVKYRACNASSKASTKKVEKSVSSNKSEEKVKVRETKKVETKIVKETKTKKSKENISKQKREVKAKKPKDVRPAKSKTSSVSSTGGSKKKSSKGCPFTCTGIKQKKGVCGATCTGTKPRPKGVGAGDKSVTSEKSKDKDEDKVKGIKKTKVKDKVKDIEKSKCKDKDKVKGIKKSKDKDKVKDIEKSKCKDKDKVKDIEKSKGKDKDKVKYNKKTGQPKPIPKSTKYETSKPSQTKQPCKVDRKPNFFKKHLKRLIWRIKRNKIEKNACWRALLSSHGISLKTINIDYLDSRVINVSRLNIKNKCQKRFYTWLLK